MASLLAVMMPVLMPSPLLLTVAVPLTAWMATPLEPVALTMPKLFTVTSASPPIATPLLPVAWISPVFATLTALAAMAMLSAVMMPVVTPSPMLLTVAVPLTAWMAMPPTAIAEIVPVLPATF